MGMERCIYLSAYMLLAFKKIEVSYDVSGCRRHGIDDFDYCPGCGNKAETWKQTRSEYQNIYELFDELDIHEDEFFISDDKTHFILLPNTGEGSIDESTETLQLEISPDLPEKSIKEFLITYAEELIKIKSATNYVESCTVKFGIVQFYN